MSDKTDSYYRAAIGAFIVDERGMLLVVHKHGYEGKWDIVKGGINVGEQALDALAREIKEELGISKYEIIAKSKISLAKFKPDYVQRQDYIGQAWNNYWVRISSNTRFDVPNDEIEKITWINIDKKTLREFLKIHDEEEVLQTLLPLEKELLAI